MNTDISISYALNRRVNWALQAPTENVYPGGPTRMQYVDGFVRKQGMGSYVMKRTPIPDVSKLLRLPKMEEFSGLADVYQLFTAVENGDKWSEVPEDMLKQISTKEGCKYYTATLPPNYFAYESVMLLENLDEKELAKVRVAVGPHGFELQLNGNPVQTNTIIAITDNDGLVTWFPGMLTPYVDINKATIKICPPSP